MKQLEIALRNPRFPANRTLCLLTLALLLPACESVVMYKPGGQALEQGDKIRFNGGSNADAAAAFSAALKSTYPDVRADAAYNLSQIAREDGNDALYTQYLKQAAAEGQPQARIQLADLYRKTGQGSPAEIEQIYLAAVNESAAANVGLVEIALQRGDKELASTRAINAEKMIQTQIRDNGDTGGNKALMIARFYSDHGDLLPPGSDYNRNADSWYRDAIAKGNTKAAEELALYWLKTGSGPAVERDVFALMLQAAKAGSNNAIKYVADAYQDGIGVAQNTDQAIYWYGKAQGNISSGKRIDMGYNLLKKGQQAEALEQFQKAADDKSGAYEAMLIVDSFAGKLSPSHLPTYKTKNPESFFSVAKKFEGEYGDKLPDVVHQMYLISAEIGSYKAAFRLAEDMDAKNTGGSDNAEADKWYRKAADLGSGKAMVLLGRRARIGQGGQVADPKEAFKWFQKAADAGMGEGQFEVGQAYLKGDGVEKNPAKAKMWLEKARVGGYALAIDVLKGTEKQ